VQVGAAARTLDGDSLGDAFAAEFAIEGEPELEK
jgi:hypothetical protein